MPQAPRPSDASSAGREAVAVFDTEAQLQSAIDELLTSGFNRAELTLLASEDAVTSKLGHRYRKVDELEDSATAPRAAYVSTEALGDAKGAVIGSLIYIGAGILMGPVAAAGGGIAAALAAAVIGGGTGGAIGVALAALIGQSHANHVEDQLSHGGLLLWVRLWDDTHEARATEILERNGGRHVHVHTID